MASKSPIFQGCRCRHRPELHEMMCKGQHFLTKLLHYLLRRLTALLHCKVLVCTLQTSISYNTWDCALLHWIEAFRARPVCQGCCEHVRERTGNTVFWQVPGISCCVPASFSAGQRGSLSPSANMQGQLSFNSGPVCRSTYPSE